MLTSFALSFGSVRSRALLMPEGTAVTGVLICRVDFCGFVNYRRCLRQAGDYLHARPVIGELTPTIEAYHVHSGHGGCDVTVSCRLHRDRKTAVRVPTAEQSIVETRHHLPLHLWG